MNISRVILLIVIFSNLINAQSIGFCLDDFLADRWKKDSSIVVNTIKQKGESIEVRIANSSVEDQIRQGKELVDKGVKVLIVVAVDGYKLKELIDYSKAKNVKVIAYDRLIYNADIDYYISFDNVKIGEIQADYITKLIPKGNYILINGPTIDPNANMFLEGQMNVLESHIASGKINIVLSKQMSEWTSMEAFIETTSFLTQFHDSIDAVIVANDGMAEGVIDALEMFGYSTVPVTGQDAEVKACKRILDNKQVITVFKPIDLLAHKAANLALDLLHEEKIKEEYDFINNDFKKVPFIKLEPTLVHKGNVQQLLIETGEVEIEAMK